MSELPTGIIPTIVYAVIALVAVLFVCFMVAPKRTLRTVNYMLNALHEFKEAKKGEPDAKIEVPNFETIKEPIKAIPDKRKSKEQP